MQDGLPPRCRFPPPTGDRVADVAAAVAWHGHVLELLADDPPPRLTPRMRDEFLRRRFPEVTGAADEAYTAILRWRDALLHYCEQAWDLVHLDGEAAPTLGECVALGALLRLDDGRPHCDQCLEAPHAYGPCPLFYPDWPPVPPEYAELLPKRRWWQFWRPWTPPRRR